MHFYTKDGGSFQKWKVFTERKTSRLTTHALPTNTNALNHSTQTTITTKITYTKPHTNIKISTLIKPKQK